jgi:hypothetical protein
MTDQSLFNQDNTQNTPANPATPAQPNPLADLLSQIKNANGEAKYKTVEDALIALKHSQEFIPQLQTQLSQKDQELAEARKIAERVAEAERTLEQLIKPSAPAQPAATVAPDDIADIVTRKLTEIETAKSQKENLTTVITAITSKFGPESEQVFYSKGKELGLSVQELNALAAKTPKAVLSLFGLTEAPAQPRASSTPSGINTSGFQPQQTTFIGKNKAGILVGATTQDVRAESDAARKMVDELHAQGKSVHDLTDPKVYFKLF